MTLEESLSSQVFISTACRFAAKPLQFQSLASYIDDAGPDPANSKVNENVGINSAFMKCFRTTQHGSLYKPSSDKLEKNIYAFLVKINSKSWLVTFDFLQSHSGTSV